MIRKKIIKILKQNAMGINAPACGLENSLMDNPYLFQLDFTVQCLPKKDKRGKFIAGTKDCETIHLKINIFYLLI